MGIKKSRSLIVAITALFILSAFRVSPVTAQGVSLPWDLEVGTEFPCRFITGDNSTGTLELWDRKVFLRVENDPDYAYNIETWEDIPYVNVSLLDTNGQVLYNPTFFEYIIQDAGLTWTNRDWFLPAIPYCGVYEETWNDVYDDLLDTLIAPWEFDVDPTILPDPYFESYHIYDQDFWGYKYNFTFEGIFYEVIASHWMFASFPSPYNCGLLQNITITGKDASSGEITNYFQLVCDPTPPEIRPHSFIIYPETGGRYAASSINYTEGDTGYAIWWTIDDAMPVDFVVYDNDTVFASGPWNRTRGYTDDHIELSLDRLEAGTHNFTLVLRDAVGSTSSRWALLVVAAADHGFFPTELPLTQIMLISGAGLSIAVIAAVVYLKRRN